MKWIYLPFMLIMIVFIWFVVFPYIEKTMCPGDDSWSLAGRYVMAAILGFAPVRAPLRPYLYDRDGRFIDPYAT